MERAPGEGFGQPSKTGGEPFLSLQLITHPPCSGHSSFQLSDSRPSPHFSLQTRVLVEGPLAPR